MLLIQYNHPFNSNTFDNLGRSKNSKPKKNATLTLELIKAEIKASFVKNLNNSSQTSKYPSIAIYSHR